ncbi:MAG: glycosyltransferase family 4 protein [Bacteroidetes bacterium]|nr:glycosyltransferase family 4 protein [Bacteroidota bacterium]
MNLILIADTFPPSKNSAAIQLRDLAAEIVLQGHTLTVLLPDNNLKKPYQTEILFGARIIRLKSPNTKSSNNYKRAINEFLMPFCMYNKLKKSKLLNGKWDGIIWYSPSIFFGILVNKLKRNLNCKTYLILRDIFPQWAHDLGVLSKGPAYTFFSVISNYQYYVADKIGIQSPGNMFFLPEKHKIKVEILNNWLAISKPRPSTININNTILANRKIFIYAGNMGVAQGMNTIIELAKSLNYRKDFGFLLIGRGTELENLKSSVTDAKLCNIVFFDEIDPNELQDLYKSCFAGLISLDPRHKTHNIPGKFISYMQCGIPVLANINPGNDLSDLIRREDIGEVCETEDINCLKESTLNMIERFENDKNISDRCKMLFEREFSVDRITRQLISSF